jgi:putative flippase GtrA
MNQLIKFCIVGCANASINYTLFYVFYRYLPFSLLVGTLHDTNLAVHFLAKLGHVSIDAAVANVIGFLAGMANSFFWNKFWTFKVAEDTKSQAGKFVITNAISLILSTASMYFFTDLHGIPFNIVWLVTTVFVTLLHFTMNKYWVFKDDASNKACLTTTQM